MWETLFSVGPLTLPTFNLFLVAGFCCSAFLFWRRGREEHYQEDQLFDGFLISFLFGLLSARAAFVLGHFSEMGLSVGAWFDLMGRPGLIGPVGLVVAGLILFRFATRNKFDAFEIMDMWVSALSLGFAIVIWGLFFHRAGWGSDLPQALQVVPGLTLKFPVWLVGGLLFGGLYVWLAKLEFRYRLISWYRNGHNVAQPGFLTAFALIYSALALFVLTLADIQFMPFAQVWWERAIYLLSALMGGLIMLSRSYRLGFLDFKKNKLKTH